MGTYKHKQLLEDIYDLIKETALSAKQDDTWAQLSHQHADEARKGLHKFLRDKSMEWDPISNTITIGKNITLTLTIKGGNNG